jgi:hypothetical protein
VRICPETDEVKLKGPLSIICWLIRDLGALSGRLHARVRRSPHVSKPQRILRDLPTSSNREEL